MRIAKLKKENLPAFLECISEESELWAPVKTPKGHFSFQSIGHEDSLDLQYTRTILPPKKLLLPPLFRMYEATGKKVQEDFSHISKKILFGIHPCDIHGLITMGQFYGQSFRDPYFFEARKKLTVIGHSCWPDENCLCLSSQTHIVEEGYDLFFTDLEQNYLVWIGSSRGDDLVRMTPDLFSESVTGKDIHKFIDWREERSNAFKTNIPFVAMPDLMELKFNDHLWEELGEACLACGSCSSVCPTCTCYNVMDKPVLGEEASSIHRCWDACTLENYSAVAGNENFREKRSDRLKLWYTHKLQSFMSKYGKPACVGCGRCVTSCPVDINIQTVAKALNGEKMDVFWRRLNQEVRQ